MYIPKQFVNHNTTEVKTFIRQCSFGILITGGRELQASHIPLDLSPDGNFLSGHLSKANPQVQELSEGAEVLSIFNGPNTYISSSWYNHENVPTWNYIAAHVKGTIHLLGEDALHQRLVEMVDKYEQTSANPVSVKGMSVEYIQKQMRGIMGFDIEITSIQASYKLSQNRDEINHKNIIKELEKKSDDNAHLIAMEMKKRVF
jgi:transcriptional regulator